MQYTAYHRLGSLLSVVAPVTTASLMSSKCTNEIRCAMECWTRQPGRVLNKTQRPAGYESIYFSSRSEKVIQHNLIVFKDAFT